MKFNFAIELEKEVSELQEIARINWTLLPVFKRLNKKCQEKWENPHNTQTVLSESEYFTLYFPNSGVHTELLLSPVHTLL